MRTPPFHPSQNQGKVKLLSDINNLKVMEKNGIRDKTRSSCPWGTQFNKLLGVYGHEFQY